MTRYAIYLVAFVVLGVIVPLTSPSSQLGVYNLMLIWGLFAMGFDFMYGYSGVVSFGHSALFGLGAYAFAIPLSHAGKAPLGIGIYDFFAGSIWLLLILSIVIAAIYALVVGTISIRTREVYFAILTLAFAQVTYTLVINLGDFTGGYNGIPLTLPELTVIPGVLTLDLYNSMDFYYLTLVIVVLTYAVLRRLTNSPMGAVLRGVRENVDRLEYIGIDERRYRIAAFTISGAVSGLAGGLYAANLSFIGPSTMDFVLSGEVIVWTILGGAGTLLGPLFGGALIYYIQESASNFITWWLIPVGLLFIAMVIVMPEGIAGRVIKFVDQFRGNSEN